jgi:hypothetical protein
MEVGYLRMSVYFLALLAGINAYLWEQEVVEERLRVVQVSQQIHPKHSHYFLSHHSFPQLAYSASVGMDMWSQQLVSTFPASLWVYIQADQLSTNLGYPG